MARAVVRCQTGCGSMRRDRRLTAGAHANPLACPATPSAPGTEFWNKADKRTNLRRRRFVGFASGAKQRREPFSEAGQKTANICPRMVRCSTFLSDYYSGTVEFLKVRRPLERHLIGRRNNTTIMSRSP